VKGFADMPEANRGADHNPGMVELTRFTGENAEKRTQALDNLLTQFGDHLRFWDWSGFNVKDFGDVFIDFLEQYNRWKKTKEKDLAVLNKLVEDDLKGIYNNFFVKRKEIEQAMLNIEEVEDLYALDKKVPRAMVMATIKKLGNMDVLEKSMVTLKEKVYSNNKVTPSALRKTTLNYIQSLKNEVLELQGDRGDIGRALTYLHKAKNLFTSKELDKALNMCRLVKVEIEYAKGMKAASSGKEYVDRDGKLGMEREVRKKKIITRKRKSRDPPDEKLEKKCSEMLRSTNGLLTKLHAMGKDIKDLLGLFMKAKPAVANGDFDTALKIAMEVNEIGQGMLVPPPTEEELRTGRYALQEEEFDFEIVTGRYSPHVIEEVDEFEDGDYILEFECSECGSFVPENAEVCPNCGDLFKETVFETLPDADDEIVAEAEGEVETEEEVESEKDKDDEAAGVEEDITGEEETIVLATIEEEKEKTLLPEIMDSIPVSETDMETIEKSDAEWKDDSVGEIVKRKPPEDQIMKFIKTKQKEAENLARQGKLDEAMTALDNILNIKSDYTPALNDKGTILFTLGETEKAQIIYDMALEIDPKSIEIWTNKAFMFHSIGNTTGAFYSYQRALALNPSNTEILTNLGALYFEIDKQDKALKYFERATEIKPYDPELWYFQGFTNEIMERWPAALKCYNEVLRREPFHEEALFGRDKCKDKLKKDEDES